MRFRILALLLVSILAGCDSRITADKVLQAEMGKQLSLEDIVFTVEKKETRREIKPEKPSGYYHYYEEHEGYLYYIISGTAQNKSNYTLDVKNILIQGIHGKKKFEGILFFSNSQDSDFIKVINSKQQLKFYIAIQIGKDDPLPNRINLYYSKKFQPPDSSTHYDTLLAWEPADLQGS